MGFLPHLTDLWLSLFKLWLLSREILLCCRSARDGRRVYTLKREPAKLWPLCPAPSLLPACSRRYALPNPHLPRFVLLAPNLAPVGSPVSLLLGCHGTNLSKLERVPGAGWKCQGLGAHGTCLHEDCAWLRLIWACAWFWRNVRFVPVGWHGTAYSVLPRSEEGEESSRHRMKACSCALLFHH